MVLWSLDVGIIYLSDATQGNELNLFAHSGHLLASLILPCLSSGTADIHAPETHQCGSKVIFIL